MNQDPLFDSLLEHAWRGKLSPGQEAQLREWLSAHPEAREDWEAELGLNEALGRLADAPVASNFTSRVLQAIDLDRAAGERSTPGRVWFKHSWFRWAAACSIVVVGLITIQSYIQLVRTEKLANNIAAVYRVAPVPNPEILTNFDVICALDRTPPPDEELLKLLQ